MPRVTRNLLPFGALLLSAAAFAQAPVPSTLTIEVENYVEYFADTADLQKLGTDPNLTNGNLLINTFTNSDHLGDIVSVNGQPAKGLVYCSSRVIGASTTSTPGRPIADVNTSTYRTCYFQIQNAEGGAVGTIYSSGPHNPPPPGAPGGVTNGEYMVSGGSGSFLGARGQAGLVQVAPGRIASASEDPSKRRIHGGGKRRFILNLYLLASPEILYLDGLPAVRRAADSATITESNPATSGEELFAFAFGLGPTRPNVDAGVAFPQSPASVVNAPVQVTVGGKSAEVVSAIGFPGFRGIYQVTFRIPGGLAAGNVQLSISSAWMESPSVKIAVR